MWNELVLAIALQAYWQAYQPKTRQYVARAWISYSVEVKRQLADNAMT